MLPGIAERLPYLAANSARNRLLLLDGAIDACRRLHRAAQRDADGRDGDSETGEAEQDAALAAQEALMLLLEMRARTLAPRGK